MILSSAGLVVFGLFLEPGGRPGPRRAGGGSSIVLSGRDWIGEGMASMVWVLLGSGLGRTDASNTRTSAGCMSSEHFGQLAWQFKRMSGSSGLKVQAAIAC